MADLFKMEDSWNVENWFFKIALCIALATVAQLIRHHLVHQKVASLIPSQGTCQELDPQ